MTARWKGSLRAALTAVACLGSFGALADVTPTLQQILVDPAAAPSSRAGVLVAIDGDTALLSEANAVGSGAQAAVFTRSGTAWTFQQRLTVADADPTLRRGAGVAVAGDTAFVGAVYAGQGKVFVFTRSGTTWTQGQTLVAADGQSDDSFGYSIAMDADTAVIGAPSFGAYVFTRTGAVWSQQAHLNEPELTFGDTAGYSVALSGDTAAYGAVFRHGPNNEFESGVVYVYTRTGAAWTLQQAIVTDDLEPGEKLGVSVALDGNTLASGAYGADGQLGAGYIFTRTGTTWTQQARVVGHDRDAGVGGLFAQACALHGDTAIFGMRLHNSATGAAYVYTRSGTAWTEQTMLVPDSFTGTGSEFGISLAFDGGTALIGADTHDTSRGAGYVFVGFGPSVPPPPPPIEAFILPAKIVAKQNTKNPAKSSLVASGVFDIGPADVDLTKAATLDVGGFSFAFPSMTLKGTTYSYSAPGIAFSVKTNPSHSSHATFKLKVTGDLTGKVDTGGSVTLTFSDGDVKGATGTVQLNAGKYALGKVRGALVAPNLYVASCKALLKTNGSDALDAFTIVAGFATDGTTPSIAPDFAIKLGGAFGATVPSPNFKRSGNRYVYTAQPGGSGVTSAVLDYAKGTITIKVKNVDLGGFAEGPNPVEFDLSLGTDSRAVTVRMVRKGKSLQY